MNKKHKAKTGHVVSSKMDKTVVVVVEMPKRHPLYKKIIRKTTRYKAHDENNKCQPGDVVKIIETRPLSKDKRWRVAEIIARGEVLEIQPGEISDNRTGAE
jgi:small subunit ribosomal protein S17